MLGTFFRERLLTTVPGMRLLIPLLCAGEALAAADRWLAATLLGAVTLTDAVLQILRPPVRPFAMTARDAGYSLAFYLAYLTDARVPALLLAPVTLIEIMACLGPAAVRTALSAELALLGIRMLALDAEGHPFAHPAWPIGVLIATMASYCVARHIKETDAARRREHLARERAKSVIAAFLDEVCRKISDIQFTGSSESLNGLFDQGADVPEDPTQYREAAARLASLMADRVESSRILTEREREVLQFMDQGHSYRDIARRLVISEGTVRAHAANILRKAEVHSRQEAVEWARSRRLL